MPEPRGEPIIVLHVGPSLEQLGGMVTVLGQILSLDFGPRFRTCFHATTSSTAKAESLFSRVARHIKHLRSLRTAIVQDNAAIVHIPTCSGFSFYRSLLDLWVAKFHGCRTILHIHGAAFDEFFERSGPFGRRLIPSGLSSADRVIALSDGWGAKLSAMAPSARISVIENAVVVPERSPDRADSTRSGPCHFVQLSKMDVWKGVDDLLAACEILRESRCDFRVTLAGPPGSAGDASTLGNKIATRNLADRVRYIGPVVGAAKDSLLREADVFILPSHHEGMPLAVLEAMASGLPVLATRVGAVPEIINEGTEGMLVAPRNPAALAAAMMTIATDPDRRGRIASTARATALRRFSLPRMAGRILELYDNLLLNEAEVEGRRVEPAPA